MTRQERAQADPLQRRRIPISGVAGLMVIAAYLVVALFAPLIAPHGEAEIIGQALLPMGEGSLLGTDQLGRDVLSRLIYGARNTIGIAALTTALSFLVGGSLGLLAAVAPTWLELALSRIFDALMAIPYLILALVLLAVFGRNVTALVVILGLIDSTRVYRLARATAFPIVVSNYVTAARIRGESRSWIMFREILPNIIPPLVAEFGLRFSFVFLSISALSFLGVGIQPPTADWGSMVAENKTLIIYGSPAPLLPAAAIALLTVSINFVLDWLVNKAGGKQ
ncbi:ABC transporter permease [Pseudaminobacter sp. 19-2017]|uniref:ABC transporter permease n=1 Tax=Pseudaminobacter soli (ex Zhang et al. 2022) TaxID=2831468 RepID=A0A942E1G3_9HYPH|nr:ABC transporter permease [Pseudaminobacter soli]MBS3652089.1 ABC transporter permease [Pseudaminobacter soli]